MIALCGFASHIAQDRGLFAGFDAFGNHIEPETLRQLDDHRRDAIPLSFRGQLSNKRTIDLDPIERKTIEATEGGKAAP